MKRDGNGVEWSGKLHSMPILVFFVFLVCFTGSTDNTVKMWHWQDDWTLVGVILFFLLLLIFFACCQTCTVPLPFLLCCPPNFFSQNVPRASTTPFRPALTLQGHTDYVNKLVLHPRNKNILVSCSNDSTTRGEKMRGREERERGRGRGER